MKILDLITDSTTGQISHTKLWQNIGMLALTVVFIKMGFAGGMTDMVMLVYGSIVAGSATASKFLSMKMGQKPPAISEKTEDK